MTAHPKVLIVDLSRWFGGSNARALGLLEAMPDGAGAIAVLRGSEVQAEARRRGIQLFEVGRHKLDIGILFRLRALIRDHAFQVLDAQNPQSKFWAAMAVRRGGCALVSTLNSWYEREYAGGLRGRLYQLLERQTLRSTDAFIVVAEEIRQLLLQDGCGEERICLIPNAVSIEIRGIAQDPDWLRESFNLPAEAIVAAAVGRCVWAKGYLHLIRALARSRHPHLHLIIVGDGRERQALESEIAQMGLGDRVTLAGYREHKEAMKIVCSADFFVMPSLSEGTPISLLEAGAMGKPIVASRVGGIPTLVEDGVHASLVEPGDEAALCDAMDQLIEQPDRAARMATAVRQHVAQRFSIHRQVEQTMDAYELAMQHAGQRYEMAKP